ncbi:MAG: hypothetical protein AB8C84_10580 [Oligoflexales bacterium]
MNQITRSFFFIIFLASASGHTTSFSSLPNEILEKLEHQNLLLIRSLNSESKTTVQSVFNSKHYQQSIQHAYWKKHDEASGYLPLYPVHIFQNLTKKFPLPSHYSMIQYFENLYSPKAAYIKKLEKIERHIQDLQNFPDDFGIQESPKNTEHEKLTDLFFKTHERNIIEGFTTVQLFRARKQMKKQGIFCPYLSEIYYSGPSWLIDKKPIYGKILQNHTTSQWHYSLRTDGFEKSIWLQSLVNIKIPTLIAQENFDEYQLSPSCYLTYKNNFLTIGHRINSHDNMFKNIETIIQKNLLLFNFSTAQKLDLLDQSYRLAQKYLQAVIKINYQLYLTTREHASSYKKVHELLLKNLSTEEAQELLNDYPNRI